MMLHRHFENAQSKNITKLEDVTPKAEKFVSEVFPPDEESPVEAPKRKPRTKKTE